MKNYIDRIPPGWETKPDAPVIIVTGEDEEIVRDNLYAFSDVWRKIGRRADKILNRNPSASRVDICSERGEVIRTISRVQI
ncbi:MAG: hypothetical protein ACREAB_14300 [Blastocatellia bacterium]